MPRREDIAAYLLVGGASQRMGLCKARLVLDGVPLALHLVRTLEPYVQCVSLVGKRSQSFEDWSLPFLEDATEERALVHGLATVLSAPGPVWRFVCATDMPDVGPEILQRLWQVACEQQAPGSYPVRHDREEPEPLPSLWRVPAPPGVWTRWGMAAQDWVRAAGLAPCRLREQEETLLAHANLPDQWHDYLKRRKEAAP